MHFEVLLGTYTFKIIATSRWVVFFIIVRCPFLSQLLHFILKTVISDIDKVTPAFLCLSFTGDSFSFIPCFCLRYISCRHTIEHMVVSCFFFFPQSDNPFLLIKLFIPLIFSVIIDLVGFRPVMLLFIFYLFPLFLFFPYLNIFWTYMFPF